jgi:hypothetical protein
MRQPVQEQQDGQDADLSVDRLRLTAQLQELAEATQWLDEEHREVLAPWWLEASGQLSRAEVVAALDQPADLVARRVAGLLAELTEARIVARALSARPRCPYIGHVAVGWDGATTPLWRRRFGRHIEDCERCVAATRGVIAPERLLHGLPLVGPVPGLPAHVPVAPGRPRVS